MIDQTHALNRHLSNAFDDSLGDTWTHRDARIKIGWRNKRKAWVASCDCGATSVWIRSFRPSSDGRKTTRLWDRIIVAHNHCVITAVDQSSSN